MVVKPGFGWFDSQVARLFKIGYQQRGSDRWRRQAATLSVGLLELQANIIVFTTRSYFPLDTPRGRPDFT